jgi:protein gp37
VYPTAHIWSDATWNPVGGCSPVSPGCRNCYASQLAGTRETALRVPLHLDTTDWVRGKPVFNGRLTALEPGHDSWTWPLTWPGARPRLLGEGQPSLIFVGDMADLFHERRPTAIIDRAVSTVAVYAVTDRQIKDNPKTLRTVTAADVAWLIDEAGPAFNRYRRTRSTCATFSPRSLRIPKRR